MYSILLFITTLTLNLQAQTDFGFDFKKISIDPQTSAWITRYSRDNPNYRSLDPKLFELHGLEKPIYTYLPGESGNPADDGKFLIKGTNSGWEDLAVIRNFNCHSYVFSHHPKLKKHFTPHVWINGSAIIDTGWTNPTHTILENFYEKQKAIPKKDIDIYELKERLQENDVLILVNPKKFDYVHSAIVQSVGDEVMLRHKLGKGPLVATSLKVLLTLYDKFEWDTLEVYKPIN